MVAIAEANSDSTFYKNIHTHSLLRDRGGKDTSLKQDTTDIHTIFYLKDGVDVESAKLTLPLAASLSGP